MKPCEGCGAPATHAGTVRNSDIVIYTCCLCHNEGHWWPCDADCADGDANHGHDCSLAAAIAAAAPLLADGAAEEDTSD